LTWGLRKNSIDFALWDNFTGFGVWGFHHEFSGGCRRSLSDDMID